MPPHLFGCGSAAPWFAFSVPSVSCPMWGRLSSLRPAFQPALAPLPSALLHPIAPPVEHAARLAMPAVTPAEQHTPEVHGSSNRHPPPRLAAWHAGLRAPPEAAAATWSKPPGLPCRRSRRQSNTIPSCAGAPTPSAATAGGVARTPPRSTSTRPLFSTSVSSVSSVVCFSPCPPCPLWFAFSVFSVVCFFRSLPPPVTTFPKSFSLSFSTTSQLALSPPLAPLLYVESERCG